MQFSKSDGFNKQILFFCFSLIAVLADCAAFQILSIFEVRPFYANFISSFIAVSINYRCVVAKIFPQFTGTSGFLIFLSWYMISIFIFSHSIEFFIAWINLPPLFCKICSLPISFVVNYYFISFLSRTLKNDRSNNDIYSDIQL